MKNLFKLKWCEEDEHNDQQLIVRNTNSDRNEGFCSKCGVYSNRINIKKIVTIEEKHSYGEADSLVISYHETHICNVCNNLK